MRFKAALFIPLAFLLISCATKPVKGVVIERNYSNTGIPAMFGCTGTEVRLAVDQGVNFQSGGGNNTRMRNVCVKANEAADYPPGARYPK